MFSIFVAYKSFDGQRTTLHRVRIYAPYMRRGRLYGLRQDGTVFGVYVSNVIACDAARKGKPLRKWDYIAAIKSEGGVAYL